MNKRVRKPTRPVILYKRDLLPSVLPMSLREISIHCFRLNTQKARLATKIAYVTPNNKNLVVLKDRFSSLSSYITSKTKEEL